MAIQPAETRDDIYQKCISDAESNKTGANESLQSNRDAGYSRRQHHECCEIILNNTAELIITIIVTFVYTP